jgi:hypothetical protein
MIFGKDRVEQRATDGLPAPRSRECLHNLLRQPFCRRVPGHREPEQLSSTVAKDEKRKQALERQSGTRQRSNGLRWRFLAEPT